jgi:hypothetical protein
VEFVLVVVSRPATAPLAQAWRHLRRSGWRLLPWLVVNYALPPLRGGLVSGVAVGDLNDPAGQALLRAAAPDLLVTLHCDQILSPATLALAPRGGVNLHPSPLPAGRGPTPVLHALASPRPSFGVTVHRITPAIDAGPILAQAAYTPPPGASASAITRALHLAGVPLLARVLAAEAAGAPLPEHRPAPAPDQGFPSPAVLRAIRVPLVTLADLRAALDPTGPARH